MANRAGEMRGTSPGLVGEVRARQTGFVRRRLFRRSSRLASSSFNSFRGPRGANEDATRRATPRAGITRREGRTRSPRVVRVIGRGRRRARATQGARRHPRRTPQSAKRVRDVERRFTRFDSRRRLASRWTTTTPRAFESRAWPRYGGTGACFSARCGPFATTRRARLAFANRSSRWRLSVLNRSDRRASARGETSRELAARSRDANDRADASAARCAVRSGRRYLATWRRAVAARVASTALEERATRFSEHRRKGKYLRPAFHAWTGYYDRITVARLMYERTLMSAARLRSRIERRFMSRRFASWSAGAVASASLERRRVRFATERTRRVAATCVLTWQWLVTASRETRAHAHGAQRDRAVRCVRAWRRHVSDKAERQTRLKKSYANVVKSRAKRTLRVWLRHASLAHAKRMKYMESKVVEA